MYDGIKKMKTETQFNQSAMVLFFTACNYCTTVFLSPQGMYVFMHAVKGTPFETPDQGKARLLTHWEQLDYGVQFTSSRKFFAISPIILYVLDVL